ncbi:hypothetical protein, partial [Chromobacterium amazonense]|uniref:hypothetical protein n=1 Tax=Chromobacterium amazonense TaxID=1382803 RepID=UPI003F78F90B
FQRAGLDLPVPSFGQLSDRFAKLQLPIKVRAVVARQRLKEDKPTDLIVDSTDLKLDQAGARIVMASTAAMGASCLSAKRLRAPSWWRR